MAILDEATFCRMKTADGDIYNTFPPKTSSRDEQCNICIDRLLLYALLYLFQTLI